MAETKSSVHWGLALAGLGIVVTVVIGVLQIPQTRNLVCRYTGIFCTWESQIRLFAVDYTGPLDATPLFVSAWAAFLYHAGSTAEDKNCFSGNSDDIQQEGFARAPNGALESYQLGSEKWTFSGADNLLRQPNRSVIFDLQIKYTKSVVNQRLTVTVKPYFLDYRIAELDRTYAISLPNGKDYAEVSCEMNVPDKDPGNYKFDFELNDLTGGSEIIDKTLNIAQ